MTASVMLSGICKCSVTPAITEADQRSDRTVQNTYARRAIAVLGDKQHRHEDQYGLGRCNALPIRLAMLIITLMRPALRSAGDLKTYNFSAPEVAANDAVYRPSGRGRTAVAEYAAHGRFD